MTRPNKFGSKFQIVDGIKFRSKAEARRYSELKLLERAGEIYKLELQPRFDLIVNGIKCGAYVADFGYYTDAGRVIEDVKGVKTALYVLKRKLTEAIYSVKITEITRASPAAWKTTMAHLCQAPLPAGQEG